MVMRIFYHEGAGTPAFRGRKEVSPGNVLIELSMRLSAARGSARTSFYLMKRAKKSYFCEKSHKKRAFFGDFRRFTCNQAPRQLYIRGLAGIYKGVFIRHGRFFYVVDIDSLCNFPNRKKTEQRNNNDSD